MFRARLRCTVRCAWTGTVTGCRTTGRSRTGSNPAVNDAALDRDADGASNALEYARGTDPFNADTDGDGIADGAEKKSPGYSGGVGSLGADASVQVIASDSRGMTIELVTKSFDVTSVVAGGQAFERLRVASYVHGFTLAAGLPQVPLKGILLDIPQGKQARVEVLDAAQPDAFRLPGLSGAGLPGRREQPGGGGVQLGRGRLPRKRLLPGGGS